MSYPPAEADRRRAIVLVHGAWVGEWSWLPIQPQLSASGRPVFAASMTGHGVRAHESGPHVGLDHHVADVRGLIETYDLTDITLVGHSYGGRVITQVWNQLGDRIRRMVYLDAHAPVADTPPQPGGRVVEGGMIPFQGYDPSPDVVGGEVGLQWFNARVMPQSAKCFSDPWQVPLPDALSKTFVFATDNEPSRFTAYANACRQHRGWRYEELAGPHFLMASHPGDVAAIILDD